MNKIVRVKNNLIKTVNQPSCELSNTGNLKAYFSGHYQTYGINVQAACDHKCRFAYAALAAPGGANDIAAFQ